MPSPLDGLLVRPLGIVEDLLIGGEERQPPADLRHCMLGDVLRVVGVDVHIFEVGARFAVGPVDLVGEIESHIEKVGDFGVGDGLDPEAILLEDCHHLLLNLFHLGRGEVADGEDIVTVGADV